MIELNENWKLSWSGLGYDASMAWRMARKEEGWLDCSLPCDIHVPLIENKVIEEPTVGLNFFDSEWTEKKAWWFKKVFDLDPDTMGEYVSLVIENIDCHGDIFLNGVHLGHHANAYYPFEKDVKNEIKEKDNELIIRVTAGLERVTEAEYEGVSKNIGMLLGYRRGDARRIAVRKPHYGFGWDWCPRIPTCGIGSIAIKTYSAATIKEVCVRTEAIAANNNEARLALEIVLDYPNPLQTADLDVEIEILDGQEVVYSEKKNLLLSSGLNYLNNQSIISNAKLWWPHGYGQPHRYAIKVKGLHASTVLCEYEAKFGIRKVELDVSKINDRERAFGLVVNGRKIFCKGGNWVPPDSMYLRAPNSSYRQLIEEAVEANLNVLRVWGGGLYERELFYELCDEKGIMVWQDLMFACALYPDRDERFKLEVSAELEYQTRRLRNHPSLVLWCGNNENQMVYDLFFEDHKHWEFAGGRIFNAIAPEIVHRNCPDIPYWNGSPYGGEHPNGTQAGDSHEWFISAFAERFEDKITPEVYDALDAKFVSEFGHVGPCKPSSVKRYLATETIDFNNEAFKMHSNAVTYNEPGYGLIGEAIEKHYRTMEGISAEDYLLFGGLWQGLMLEYALDTMRSKPHCDGAIFWMYNDCWGEVGWTIIDYYLERKISFPFVRRAFDPRRLVIRKEENAAVVYGINETEEDLSLEAEFGYASYDGKVRLTTNKPVVIKKHSRSPVLRFALDASLDPVQGCWFVKPADNEVNTAILRLNEFSKREIGHAQLSVSNFERIGQSEIAFDVQADRYAHAVHFGLADGWKVSDEYFDLLPLQSKRIVVQGVPQEVNEQTIRATSVYFG